MNDDEKSKLSAWRAFQEIGKKEIPALLVDAKPLLEKFKMEARKQRY